MKNNWLNKIKKGLVLSFLIGSTVVSSIIPVLANEIQEIDISQWAIATLNEGERYGVFPIDWYADGFRQEIKQNKLNLLLKNTESKLAHLELEKDQEFGPIVYEVDGSRGSVITALYNTLAQYKLPVQLENEKKNAVQYMQNRGIVNGTDVGLDLKGSCTLEQATVMAIKVIQDTYHAAGAGAKGLMWEVNHKGNRMYLLGSIHVGESDLYPIHKRVTDAFEGSDMLIVEANVLNEENLDEFLKAGMYSDGSKLPDHVSKETYEKAQAILMKMGLPTDSYDDFKPWIIANELSVMSVVDPNSIQEEVDPGLYGIDMYFLTRGLLEAKPLGELEGVIEQANLFNSMPIELQEHQLSMALDSILNPDSDLAAQSVDLLQYWFEKWHQGDIDGFAESFAAEIGEDRSQFDQMLFGERDAVMAGKLSQLLEAEGQATYFVVIGAGHLVEKNTVKEQLEGRGYTLTRYWQ